MIYGEWAHRQALAWSSRKARLSPEQLARLVFWRWYWSGRPVTSR